MMRATLVVAGLAIVSLLMGVVFADDKSPTIIEIMTKAHKSRTGLRDQIKKEADSGSPNWTNVQKMTKEFVALASALEKNDPPKGDKAGWKKLSQEYYEQVKGLDAAAGKKDTKAVADANRKLGSNCKGCHDAHMEE
jgi:cytochrome c556